MSRQAPSQLSDHELLSSLNRLVCRERVYRVDILNFLNEVERRKLHVRMGHSSLFEYCTSRLRYSSSAAWRRIASARAMRRFPEIGAMLTSGEVNLVTIAMVAKLLTPGNKDALLARVRGGSQDEVRAIVAEYRPEAATRDRVRPVCVKVVAPTAKPAEPSPGVATEVCCGQEPTPTSDSGSQALEELQVRTSRDDPANDTRRTSGPGGSATLVSDVANRAVGEEPRAVVVRKSEIRFIAGEAFVKKLERMKCLLATGNANPTLEQVFDAAMEAFLDAKCPLRRAERRRRKGRRSLPPVGVDRGCEGKPQRGEKSPPNRHIRAAVRDRVFERDGGRCVWVGPDGHRCNATRRLEVDHVTPFGKGGANADTNLRLLCRAHNILAAEQAYGKSVIARYALRE